MTDYPPSTADPAKGDIQLEHLRELSLEEKSPAGPHAVQVHRG